MSKPSYEATLDRPYVCNLCGRTMKDPRPHICNKGYRKRHLSFTNVHDILKSIEDKKIL